MARVRFCRAKLDLLWLERVREKFVCHTDPATALSTALGWKSQEPSTAVTAGASTQQTLATSLACENQWHGLDTEPGVKISVWVRQIAWRVKISSVGSILLTRRGHQSITNEK